jgi:hypothetical protein
MLSTIFPFLFLKPTTDKAAAYRRERLKNKVPPLPQFSWGKIG